MNKYVIVAKVNNLAFFYSLSNNKFNDVRTLTNYFSCAFIFETIESARKEFCSIPKEDKKLLLFKLKNRFNISEEEILNLKFSINEITLTNDVPIEETQSSLF